MKSAQSPYQFAAFRWLMGIYLAVHFAHLLPWGPELFSAQGALPDPSVSPLYGLFPNLLAYWDSPASVRIFLALMALVSLSFAFGIQRQTAALLLWYGWTCLFNRNPLISNPGLPYVGLILVLSALVPSGEGLRPGQWSAQSGWAMPLWVPRAAFFLLMAGYTYSGLGKLQSPSWRSGEVLGLLADNPLARDWFFRDLLKSLPAGLLRAMGWGALAAEILALPLCLFPQGRALAWLTTLSLHLGILMVIDFADLTLGMVMAHLFVFNPLWLPAVKAGRARTVFFDGVCALCDGTVRFLISEDPRKLLRFAPLQGSTAALKLGSLAAGDGLALKSIVYLREGENALTRSSAVLGILKDLGGFWRLLSWLRLLPAPLRDLIYNWIGENRYRWFGQYEACRLPGAGEKELFLP